ncbi:MAG: hypothetical protein ABSF10_09020 [Verrucomicrobiota bacterium]
MSKIMMGELWQSQFLAGRLQTFTRAIKLNNPVGRLRIFLRLQSRQERAQFFRHGYGARSSLGFCSRQKKRATLEVNVVPKQGSFFAGLSAADNFADARARICQKFNQVRAILGSFLIALVAVRQPDGAYELLQLVEGGNDNLFGNDLPTFDVLGRIGKKQAAIQSKFKNRFHNIQFMDESFRSERCTALLHPTVAILRGEIADRNISERGGESFDIHFPAFDGAGTQCVFVRLQP